MDQGDPPPADNGSFANINTLILRLTSKFHCARFSTESFGNVSTWVKEKYVRDVSSAYMKCAVQEFPRNDCNSMLLSFSYTQRSEISKGHIYRQAARTTSTLRMPQKGRTKRAVQKANHGGTRSRMVGTRVGRFTRARRRRRRRMETSISTRAVRTLGGGSVNPLQKNGEHDCSTKRSRMKGRPSYQVCDSKSSQFYVFVSTRDECFSNARTEQNVS